jgi:hypothetical protein
MAAARVLWRGYGGDFGEGEKEKERRCRGGPCPFLPRKRRGAMMLAAMYPATKLRSPRATASSSPQSAQ